MRAKKEHGHEEGRTFWRREKEEGSQKENQGISHDGPEVSLHFMLGHRSTATAPPLSKITAMAVTLHETHSTLQLRSSSTSTTLVPVLGLHHMLLQSAPPWWLPLLALHTAIHHATCNHHSSLPTTIIYTAMPSHP